MHEVPLEGLAPGRLWLGSAPGRPASEEGAPRLGQMTEDLGWLRRSVGVEMLVGLLEAHEQAALGDLRGKALRQGMVVRALPIPEGRAPLDAFDYAREALGLACALREGRSLGLHGWAGLGRPGTLAAAVLQALGRAPQAALARVREACPGAAAHPAQEAFLLAFPEALAKVRSAHTRLRRRIPVPLDLKGTAEREAVGAPLPARSGRRRA